VEQSQSIIFQPRRLMAWVLNPWKLKRRIYGGVKTKIMMCVKRFILLSKVPCVWKVS
jgi:hypothetical protein